MPEPSVSIVPDFRVTTWRLSVAVQCLRCMVPTVFLLTNVDRKKSCPGCGQELVLGGLEWSGDEVDIEIGVALPEPAIALN